MVALHAILCVSAWVLSQTMSHENDANATHATSVKALVYSLPIVAAAC